MSEFLDTPRPSKHVCYLNHLETYLHREPIAIDLRQEHVVDLRVYAAQ